MALIFLVLVVMPIIVLVGMALRAAEVWEPAKGSVTDRSGRSSRGRATAGVGGLAASSALSHEEDDDMMTNPIYSHLPGNIYHSISEDSSDDGLGSEIEMTSSDVEIDSGPDLLTDPIYSDIPGNIYYTDDDPLSTSSFDDSFSDDSFSSSSFDDDFGGSSPSSAFDDDWSSSSFDDNWGGSSFDD